MWYESVYKNYTEPPLLCNNKINLRINHCDFLSLCDIGIDPSKWDSVFESFEQADPSTTRL